VKVDCEIWYLENRDVALIRGLSSSVDSSSKTEELPPIAAPPRGRPFARGNPGRKRGTKNRATVVAQALVANEAAALVHKAIELANAGDVSMLRFFLARILPRERPVHVDIPPLEGVSDAVQATRAIVEAACAGRIVPAEAASLANVISAHVQTLNLAAVEARLAEIERKLSAAEQKRIGSTTRPGSS
jgi:hypothetical protein